MLLPADGFLSIISFGADMLSLLLGLSLSLHLMTYQAGEAHLEQTLTTTEIHPGKVVYVAWTFKEVV